MILICLGTQPHQFKRLINDVDKLLHASVLQNQTIYIQHGETEINLNQNYIKNNQVIARSYFPDFDELVKASDLIITHGGVGTIISALLLNKKVIAMPRLKKYHEHLDDHQQELLNKMAEQNYICEVNNYDELKQAVQQIVNQEISFKTYQSNNQKFNNKLYDEVQKLLK